MVLVVPINPSSTSSPQNLPKAFLTHRRTIQKVGDRLHTLKDPNSCREIVDAPGGAQRSGDDGGGRYEIVGERVVEVAL